MAACSCECAARLQQNSSSSVDCAAIQDNRMNAHRTDRENPLLIAYSLVKRSGFLRTSLGRRLFKSAYFLYKRYIEDDLHDLVRSFPALVGAGNILDIGANIGYTAAVLARAAEPVARSMPSNRNLSTSGFCSRPRFSLNFEAKSSQCNWLLELRTGPLTCGSTIATMRITGSPQNSFVRAHPGVERSQRVSGQHRQLSREQAGTCLFCQDRRSRL